MGTHISGERQENEQDMPARGGTYEIRYVEPDDLPSDQDWMFVQCGDALYFVVKRDHCERELEEAWAAFRAIADGEV